MQYIALDLTEVKGVNACILKYIEMFLQLVVKCYKSNSFVGNGNCA